MNPKQLTCCDYYLQIPSNAEVKAIPFNSLPNNVRQKFRQMDNYIDGSNAPHVIFVSPVTKSTLQIDHKLNTLNKETTKQTCSEGNHRTHFAGTPNTFITGDEEDAEDCFVPIRSSKKIASTILQLSGKSNNKTAFIHDENTGPKLEDALRFNLRVVDIRVRALCKYKNTMYLLPAQKANVSEEQDSPGIMDKFSPRHGIMKYQCNKMEQNNMVKNTRPDKTQPYHDEPLIHLDKDNILPSGVFVPQQSKDNILPSGVFVPQQSLIEKTHNKGQFSIIQRELNPTHGYSLQHVQHPLAIKQFKRKIYCEDAKAVKKRPNPEGSDTDRKRNVVSISSTSLEMAPCVPEEFPSFSCYPSQISPSRERVESAGSTLSKPLLNMKFQIPQPTSSCEDCSDFDSRSSSPFSAVTISTNTSEGFESDQNEEPLEIRRRPEQASSLYQQAETAQDKTAQRLLQCCPLAMEQIKGKMYFKDAKSIKKRPSPGGSDTDYKRKFGTMSSTSSIMEPAVHLETSPCVPEEFPGFSCYPSQISPSKERAVRAGSPLSKPLLNMEPQIPQPTSSCEDCSDFDSRSSSPFSAVSISTNTSEGFESDQNEEPFSMRRRPDQESFLSHEDETTQDERSQRLLQRVRELNEQVENIRAEKTKI
ncbi:hypothetical protein AB205_0043060 [Aquarana catesbeiana]|uniref:Uncharacterized protein n=1 Tax=Aquarana catesbeiana TaxID=8400 RepID=A0A2G9REB3_AQUCT|nr:hypothetical protein AB205_0043060 [Aquarana catesbeiana]